MKNKTGSIKKIISLVLCVLMVMSFGPIQAAYAELGEGAEPATTYTVKFVNWDDSVIETQEVEDGEAAVAPENIPTREGFEFTGWDKDFLNVTEDITVTAQYKELETVTVTINYILAGSNAVAAQPFVATLKKGDSFERTVESPEVTGFTPDKAEIVFDFDAIEEDVEELVLYTGSTETGYTVKHYQQNVVGDGYTVAATESFSGETDTLTAAEAKTYTGFTVKAFEQKYIAADGKTIINIYYITL